MTPPDAETVARWALGLDGRDAARCRSALEAHAETIHAAIEPAMADPPRAAAWLTGLEALAMQGAHDRYFALVDRARDALDADPGLAAWLVMRRGRMAFLKGFYGQAAADARWAEAQVADAADAPTPDARFDDWPPRPADVRDAARLLRAVIDRNSGDPAAALGLAEVVERAASTRQARPMRLQARFQVACALQVLGRRTEAEAAYRGLFGEIAALGAERLRALVLANLGIDARARGDDEAARAWQAEASALLDRLGDRLMGAKVGALAGDAEATRARIEAVGDEESRLLLELARGDACAETGDTARAAVIFDQIRWTADALRLGWIAEATAHRREALRPALRIDPTGFTLPDGRRVDLRRHRAPRAITRRLAEARAADEGPVSAEELIAAGWPGERMQPASGLTRVYTAVRTLRRLGLDGLLLTEPDGYRLIGPVAWDPG